MNVDGAPTFNSLNKPQQRALTLRDELRYTDDRHLDTFIEGIANDEPPTYKWKNGAVAPALVMVTLKDTAIRFDLGNVHFDNDVSLGSGVYRTYLTVEDGRFELRTGEALLVDDDIPKSVPIHIFIAKNMVPLFEAKFKAIWARKNKINEIRQVAFNMATQPTDEFPEGETLAVLDPERSARNGTLFQAKKPKKRRTGDPISKHSSNKRKRVGLDTISQEAKAATFNSIPDQIKVDLFNNVIKTAFPNFDNLMIASWNVVSVYSNVGTDFPELHKSIVDLKSVLQDFEESVGARVSHSEPKLRRDFAPQEEANDTNGNHSSPTTPNTAQDGARDSATGSHGGASVTSQQQDDTDSLFNEPEPDSSVNTEMPPPRIVQMSQRHQNDETEGADDIQSDTKPKRHSSILQSSLRFTPETQLLRKPSLEPNSARSSPGSQLPRDRTKKAREPSIESRDVASPELMRRREEYRASSLTGAHSDTEDNDPKPKSYDDMSLPDLRAMYKDRKRKLLTTFGGNANVPQQHRMQMQQLSAEIKAREQKEEQGEEATLPKFLGNSLLGGKKPLGTAPVAPMVHLKKDSGGKGGANGGVRRGN